MTDIAEPDLDGPAAPPRQNGEIVFAAPWERRAFGLAVTLCRNNRCDWEAFRQKLIRNIAEHPAGQYWENWAAALEAVVADSSLVANTELDARHVEILNRPSGHDH
jgi:nitrile hydratase accessory protein